MNPIRSLLLGVAVAVGGMALVALFLPSGYHSRAQQVINAPAGRIFPYINNLPQWKQWAFAGYDLEADSVFQFAGPEEGEGALLLWQQAESEGRLELVSSEAPNKIALRMSTNHGEFESSLIFTLEQADSAHTVVKCEEMGDVGFKLVARYFVALGGLEKAQGRKYQQALDDLKALVERP